MRYAVANWKMNVPPAGVEEWARSVTPATPQVWVGVAPPFPFIGVLGGRSELVAGAQNCGAAESGAFTGEVAASMLRSAGAEFCIVGHSERRTLFGETDDVVGEKLGRIIDAGLMPVLCIGEDLETRERGGTAAHLERQIAAVRGAGIERCERLLVAYEPIWAIGTGRNATPAMVAETSADIVRLVRSHWGEGAAGVSLLYGGSVTPENAGDLAAVESVDGFLVGGASLDSGKFSKIIAALA